MSEKLIEFLRKRNIDEDVLRRLGENKIDHHAILSMTDDELKEYLPAHGDRILVHAFCSSLQSDIDGEPSAQSREALLDKLRQKTGRFQKKRGAQYMDSKNSRPGNKNAKKAQRRIELGWMNYEKNGAYKQVRIQNMGGIRHLKVEKDTHGEEILDTAKDLFSEGLSRLIQKPAHMKITIKDCLMRDIGNATVETLYEELKVKLLRLYMCTEPASSDEECDGSSVPVPESQSQNDVVDLTNDTAELVDLCTAGAVANEDQSSSEPQQVEIGPESSLNIDDDDVDSGTPTIVFNTYPHQVYNQMYSSIDSLPDLELGSGSEQQSVASIETTKGITVKTDTVTGAVVLKNLEDAVKTNCKKNIVNVARQCVFLGGVRAFNRSTFDATRQLSVKFAGEFGIDDGGPTREFLRLLMTEVQRLPVFTGPDHERMLNPDCNALRCGNYKLVGEMMAYSLVHRGPAPAFLSPHLFEALVKGCDDLKPGIDHITDRSFKDTINKVAISVESSFREAVDDADTLIEMAGCYALTMHFHQKDRLVSELIHFVVWGRTRQCFDHFCEGLKTLGVLSAIHENSEVFKQYFCHTNVLLDAQVIEQLFVVPDLSDKGSNRRSSEELTLSNWRDYLIDLEEGQEDVKIADVLIYATGADRIPPLGFTPAPTLSFHEPCLTNLEQIENFPSANTCSNTLDIPLITVYSTFKANMNSAISLPFFSTH